MHKYKTLKYGNLNNNNIGEYIKVSGSIKSKRYHREVLFIEISDYYNKVQAVFL